METLMPLNYFRKRFAEGAFVTSDINAAIDELVSDGQPGAERISVNQVVALLRQTIANSESDSAPGHHDRRIQTVGQWLDQTRDADWNSVICDEISKHCAAHYDEGQAIWKSPWRDLPLYQAWRSALRHDRSFELHGIRGFRKFVAQLPDRPQDALLTLLDALRVPQGLWSDILLCYALAMNGWCAWTQYKHRQAATNGGENSDFAGLLAMRLTYEVALAAHFEFEIDWGSISSVQEQHGEAVAEASDAELTRYLLLKALEIAYRRELLDKLATDLNGQPNTNANAALLAKSDTASQSKLAQMVFCIDVRSERIRRHLEASSDAIETYGFAGFFGLPIEYVPLGASKGTGQVPFLASPQFKVYEEIAAAGPLEIESAVEKRSVVRSLRKAWKEFQTSAIGCFGFVETTGLFYGFELIAQSFRTVPSRSERFDGVSFADRKRLGPSLRGLGPQEITTSKQVDLAESILRGIGLIDGFARLVVFCGHGSQTENNPLQAGLDCGACGGHSGEANARLAAKLLNQTYIRRSLAKRGIVIGDDVHFAAALHNTTTDSLEFFDTDEIPPSHVDDLRNLEASVAHASQGTRVERLDSLPGAGVHDLLRRSEDWSEVRPEWGLAGNAAFIVGPRSLTQSVSLDGRSFLHSYDFRRDPEFKVLEQIMTAPMVVAHWINMQYYASTVDPEHLGSGSKAIHNVVGKFGVLSGNGGDLTTGLPWQSVHDGEDYQHHPLRLLAVIAAPRDAIAAIIGKHEILEDLLTNGWLNLVAVEGGSYYRYTEQRTWDELSVPTALV
jgi:uncharacterized protein YbcC (UPF0753/DUF2309 family)